uniref:Smr domain-containing protein n=1 Tax=Parascaris univalens TaxID=6257 RepID=A0A915BJQ6_PARUN
MRSKRTKRIWKASNRHRITSINMTNGNTHEQCWDGTTDLENIKRCIKNGHPVLLLMRGVPGSGKSYLARELLAGTNGVVHSTDNYFIENGVYTFDANKLQEFHLRNLKEAKNAMSNGIKPIIIDNTNIYARHMQAYITQAVKFLYEIYFVEPQTEWKMEANECARRNTHSIAVEKISYLLETFEAVSLREMIKPVKLKLKPPLEADDDEHTSFGKDFSLFYAGMRWSLAKIPGGEHRTVPLGLPVPPTDGDGNVIDLCGGTAAMNSNNGGLRDQKKQRTECGDTMKSGKKLNTKPLVSLLPFKQPSLMPQLSIGVQTSDLIRILYVSGNVDDEILADLATKPQLTIVKRIKFDVDAIKKDRSTQTDWNFIPSELNLLMALFPEEAPADLSHVLQRVGIDMTLSIFREIGAKMDIFAHPEEVEVPDESTLLSQTFECMRHEPKANQLDAAVVTADSGSSKIDAHSSCTVASAAKPVKSGFYRMELSIDMIRKLSELFGDNGRISETVNSYVDLPLWQWRKIYQAWQGLSITDQHEEAYTCVDFNDEFPDLMKAKRVEEPLEKEYRQETSRSSQHSRMKTTGGSKKMDTAARLQLNRLYEKFRNIDRNRIDECFEDNNYSASATETTLNFFMTDECLQPSVVAASSPPRDFDNVKGMPERDKEDLLCVQQEAITLQEEIEHCLRKKRELCAKANDVKDVRVKQFYILEAQNFDRRAREYSAKANQRLADANTATNFVDLHFMDVSSALRLLRSKLNALDRPTNLRNGRSGRKVVVVTGYGKSASGFSKLKPAVLQWLNQRGYEYHQSANQGEIVVEAK